MIEVTHYYGVHQGGTKDYHLYLFASQKTGKHIIIKRWGKTGSDGQSKIELNGGSGEKQLDTWLKERAAKGYDMRRNNSQPLGKSSYRTVQEALEDNLPRSVMRSLTNAQVAQLDPDHAGGTGGSAYDPLASQRDKMRSEMERAAKAAEEKREAEERAASDEMLKSNPYYGMF